LNTKPSSGARAKGIPTFCARKRRNISLEFPMENNDTAIRTK